jgi:oligopeptide/dipeptide ABC transporter ATP-binding protein
VTPFVEVRDLHVTYGETLAVQEASIAIDEGRTLAIVGESGSGKSSLALALARLLPPTATVRAGQLRVGDQDMLGLEGDALRSARGQVAAYLPQDSMAALNPVLRIGLQVGEVLRYRSGVSKREADERAVELLAQMGIQRPDRVARMYSHQLSGGMRQRVMIAMALAQEPRLLIADEPTTALDLTAQAEILALVRSVQRDWGMTIIWITHDMGVVAEIADDIAIMYGGQIMEQATARAVFANPLHPYTQALLETRADELTAAPKARFTVIEGSPPSGATIPGCPFHPRCALREERCGVVRPPLQVYAPGHSAACHVIEGSR